MKNNKGFTLVELLAVIVVLGLIIAIAVPSITAISTSIKQKMYETKIRDIETAAKLYADDLEVPNNTKITVGELVRTNYYKKENKDCSIGSNDNPCVTSPVDNTSLDNETITITMADNRYKATFNK